MRQLVLISFFVSTSHHRPHSFTHPSISMFMLYSSKSIRQYIKTLLSYVVRTQTTFLHSFSSFFLLYLLFFHEYHHQIRPATESFSLLISQAQPRRFIFIFLLAKPVWNMGADTEAGIDGYFLRFFFLLAPRIRRIILYFISASATILFASIVLGGLRAHTDTSQHEV